MKRELEKAANLLPTGNVRYPEEIVKRQEDLLAEMKVCKNEGGLAVRLHLIAKALRLFSDQTRHENINKVRMMAVCERDRIRRQGRKTHNAREMDPVQP
jgi:hypothetical protein